MRGHAVEPVSATFRVDTALDLRDTLFAARVGPRDPCVRFVGSDAWRASRTPCGIATECLCVLPDGSVRVEAWGPGADWFVQHVPSLLGFDDDPRSFEPDHPLLRRLVFEHRGLRMGRTEAVFEAAMGIVLEQRVASPDAWRSWRALVFALGERAPGPLAGLWVPPSPSVIARTPYEVFHRFGIERRRSEILRRMAVVAARLEECLSLPLADAYARLAAVPWIGPWTRGRLGLVAFGDADAVVVGDLHLPHAVCLALAGEHRGTDERMLELLEPYRGQRGRVVRLLLAAAVFKR